MARIINTMRAGEVSPRVDLLKSADIVANGMLKARNVVVNPQGGVRKRPGLQWLANLNAGRSAATAANWARLFAWDKSPEERLNLCYAASGEFRVMLEDGSLIDVEGRGNPSVQNDLQFQNLGNRVVLTDGTEPRHILANPVNVGGDVILLTRQMDLTEFSAPPSRLPRPDDEDDPFYGGALSNFAGTPVTDTNVTPNRERYPVYTPPADQPISLSAFDNSAKHARLSVGELRSVFVVAAGGADAVTAFTNNPHTYKNPSTTITIHNITRGSDNRLRLVLSSFPNWLEKAVVRWGNNTREFTSANSFSTALEGAELTEWNAGGSYSVELVRRTDDAVTRNLSIRIESENTGGVYFGEVARVQGRLFNAANLPDHGSLIHTGGTVGARPQVTSGRYPRGSNIGGNWRLRRLSDGRSVTGALSFTDDIIFPGLIVGSAAAMITAFGIDSPAGEYALELERGFARAGFGTNVTINGVNITDVSLALNENRLRVTQTGLTSARRLVVVVGGQTIAFGAGQTTINLNAAQRSAWAAALQFTIRAENVAFGLEANEASFFAMAVEYTASGARAVYIKGRDFYTLNAARGLEWQPLVDNRVVSGLIVDSRFRNQAEVVLQTYTERVLPLVVSINRQLFTGSGLSRLLRASDFISFRPPLLNPPVVLFDGTDADNQFAAEQTRIGKRFCVQTASTSSGEYELEWAAETPVDQWGNELIPVGGLRSLAVGSRPVLTRRGITKTFENSASPPVETQVTGWKYAPSIPEAPTLQNTIVNIPARGYATPSDIPQGEVDPRNNFDEPGGFADTPVAAKGTLISRTIATNDSLIGKPPGRYAMEWNDTDGFPVAASAPQNRVAYAGSKTHPARIWMSLIGRPHNFLDARPSANDPKTPTTRSNYAVRLDLDTSAIRQMVNDAALLIFTQNEAHIANGPFDAENLATSHTRRFGRLGQEENLGAAIIDENIFVFSNGAPFGLLYDGIDIGYISQNLSAQRNEEIMLNYNDDVVRVLQNIPAPTNAEGVSEPRIDGDDETQVVNYNVAATSDLTANSVNAETPERIQRDNPARNEDLRPVRIVATQPQGLNGAYLVLYLMSDGTIRAFHTLHREGFFAWSRWSFFDAQNKNADGTDVLGAARRKIIDISAQGRLVTLLDNRGNIYTLNGENGWDDLDGAAGTPVDPADPTGLQHQRHGIDLEVRLTSYAIPDPRLPGQAVINPKQLEFVVLHFNALSGTTMMEFIGDKTDKREVPLKPQYYGRQQTVQPKGTPAQSVFVGRRKMLGATAFNQADESSDKEFTVAVTNNGTEAWELLRVESEVDIGSVFTRLAFGRGGQPPPS